MYKMMNLETKEQLILAKAIDAFQKTTGLQINHIWQEGPADALLTIQTPDHPIHFVAEIKGVLGLDECWVGEDCSIPDMIAFARAILREAQE